jgi:hypothetical protein
MPKENIARLAWISDSQRVAKHLAGVQDSPNELQRFPNVLRESPENLGLRKLFRNLEEKIDSATLGTEFSNVRPDQSQGSATSYRGTALSNGSNVVTTELNRGARAWGDVHNLEDTLDLNSSTKEHFADSVKDRHHTM